MKKIGDTVVVKKGEKIPDLNIDMTGWRGRIIKITSNFYEYKMCYEYKMYYVAWDSITLENIGFKVIKRLVRENIDWEKDFFFSESIKKSKPRDSEEDVRNAVTKIKERIKKYKEYLSKNYLT